MTSSEALDIQLNGEKTRLSCQLSLSEFIHQQDFGGRFVIVINDEMVPKSRWEKVMLHTGDRIDVVSPISGG
jgi:sulfur carrier protein